ncbi:MAG: hypothetical protein MZU95_07540, partial [Desulfomicrobium escambiense]|nr:hypothetical protein [Desulfomicrobium escambiense]
MGAFLRDDQGGNQDRTSTTSSSSSPFCISAAISWAARFSGGEQQMLAISRALHGPARVAAAGRTVAGVVTSHDQTRFFEIISQDQHRAAHHSLSGRAERLSWRSSSPTAAYVMENGAITLEAR